MLGGIFATTVKILNNLTTLSTTVDDLPQRVIPKKFTYSSQTTSHTLVSNNTTYFQTLSISGRGILLYLLSNSPTDAGKYKIVIDGVETIFVNGETNVAAFSDYRFEYHASLVVYTTYPGALGAASVVCNYKILTES